MRRPPISIPDDDDGDEELSTVGKIIIAVTAVSFAFMLFLAIGTLCKKRLTKNRKDTFMIDNDSYKVCVHLHGRPRQL